VSEKTAIDVGELRQRATRATRHFFGDFVPGRRFDHRWARTLTETDNVLFTTLTLSYNPLYFDSTFASSRGHSSVVLHPMLVFLTAFGLSVEDLSEVGGLLLGVDEVRFSQHSYPGDTLRASSVVLEARDSESHPEAGIVRWRTVGTNQREEEVVEFQRTNLVLRETRDHGAS
jgi:itaconyl-CoA hydratase